MAASKLDQLIFAQGGKCFFCGEGISREDASVEHLVPVCREGTNHNDNCVACCKSLNELFGSVALKEKIRIILNQGGKFVCPASKGESKAVSRAIELQPKKTSNIDRVIADLQRRGSARPATVAKLKNTIKAVLQNGTSEEDVNKLIQVLQSKKIVSIAGTKVAYTIEKSKG